MADRPIIFSAPMIRALLAGDKTQTRRLAWREAKIPAHFHDDPSDPTMPVPTIWQKAKPGDRLWVREKWAIDAPLDQVRRETEDALGPVILHGPYYWTNEQRFGGYESGLQWRSSIHMPRWASRLTLIVTGKRLERVQDISEEDAVAEGLISQEGDGGKPGSGYKWRGIGYYGGTMSDWGRCFHAPNFDGSPGCSCKVGGPSPAQCAYHEIWDRLHGVDAWEENAKVVALTFTVHETNIDALETAAHG